MEGTGDVKSTAAAATVMATMRAREKIAASAVGPGAMTENHDSAGEGQLPAPVIAVADLEAVAPTMHDRRNGEADGWRALTVALRPTTSAGTLTARIL